MADLADELNLSEKQKEELKAKKQEHREAMKKLHEALREKKIELREELEKPDSNKKRIAFLASETKELMGKLVDINIKNILGVKEVLTPEQFEKFMDMHEAMTKKRFEFREKRKMPE
jgi:Spy/CpxP family protein refolding chaperone